MSVNRVCQFEVHHSHMCVKDGVWKMCMFCLTIHAGSCCRSFGCIKCSRVV
jgi:hypothetical protein